MAFENAMEPFLREGKDVLYIGFSSALSNTYNAGAMAAVSLAEKYPERRVLTVDSLCASLGPGTFGLSRRDGKKKREIH